MTGALERSPVAALDLVKLRASIRTLIELEENDDPILSCYLNVGARGSAYAGRRAAEIRRALPPGQRVRFDETMAPLSALVEAGLDRATTSVVAFARAGVAPFFLSLQFQVPVEDRLSLDTAPAIYGLVELKDTYHRYVVLLMTEEYARILEITLGAITTDLWAARPALQDRVGSMWTREQYQHHRRDRGAQFIHEKLEIVERLMAKRGHGHLVLAGPAAYTERVRAVLPPRLASKLIDVVDVAGTAGTSEVVTATIASFIAREQQESLDAAALLGRELRRGGLAVAGTRASLGALELGQVDMLILDAAYTSPGGWRCRACGAVQLMSDRPGTCHRCGDAGLVPVDVRDELVKLAERHGTTVEIVRDSELLASLGGVGCLLRYQQAWRPEPG